MQTSLSEYKSETNFPVSLVVNKINSDNDSVLLNKFKYGQYFTKMEIVERVFKLIQKYKNYSKEISILEPSSGTGNFISVLSKLNFRNIISCEIDPSLTETPMDFFNFPVSNRFDLIIGNPPFTKYNVAESYYYSNKYTDSKINPSLYLTKKLLVKEKEKIENIFILKSLLHLNNSNSSLAFVLPISFFIKNRNKEIKEKILEKFSTIIIFQNDKVWFDYHIPCCFAIFTNSKEFENKIITIYENSEFHEHIYDLKEINEELIPEVIFNKKNSSSIQEQKGDRLHNFISDKRVKCKKSFKENNVSAKNILENKIIPSDSNVSDYKLAIVRVGNSSVGKCGLINSETDILNDMFYIFDFKEKYSDDKKFKEEVCAQINKNQDYFKQITCRVGSKSIKKEDVFNFKVELGITE